jgi:hypothetical protein
MRDIIGYLYANHEDFSSLLSYLKRQIKSDPHWENLDIDSISVKKINEQGIELSVVYWDKDDEDEFYLTNNSYPFSWSNIVHSN